MATRSAVAQANSSVHSQTPSTSGQGSKAPRVITLEKPTSDQAVIVHLDGPAVLNLADIAAENITLVRVGDKLVILFDNKATITIEPVFNAAGEFQDLQFQLGDNRVVDGGAQRIVAIAASAHTAPSLKKVSKSVCFFSCPSNSR